MCWACDMDQAKALLIDSQRVLNEAKTLKRHGTQMQAQALSEKHKAEQACNENPALCTEESEDDKVL